eukprot:CAMPEP_0115132152 /NCGR_PEP_ID=MMETSP0227-20121206/53567_1 /TAXON_ID=89957 /ORGANISM="Polarella glacialis, Strain CCMP 1383" /LENGTH=47 /DNA_ID= /DNA_START= /DNA_END= /DNA_ORIENTATION=
MAFATSTAPITMLKNLDSMTSCARPLEGVYSKGSRSSPSSSSLATVM